MSAVATPHHSLDQRLAALEHANRVRIARKELKLRVKAREEEPVPVVLDPPEWALTMRVVDFLLACPGIGQTKAHEILRRAGVSPAQTLGGVTMRQRLAVASMVRSVGGR